VGRKKIRAWIKAGLLEALDVGTAGRSQLRIMPAAIKALEERLAVRKPQTPRRRRENIDPEIEDLLLRD
jgi:hypothetical protein